MADLVALRRIVLETIGRRSTEWAEVRRDAVTAARQRQVDLAGTTPELAVDKIFWDLIIERLATFGSRNGQADARFPFVYLTPLGEQVLEAQEPLHDPAGYLEGIRGRLPNLDPVIAQYLLEAVHALQANLLFGSAVLCGAAAERAILHLLEAIQAWDPKTERAERARDLLNRPRLPSIFGMIDEAVEEARRDHQLPYEVHQSVTRHLLSFQEMIRVQRNEAVHPAIATVSREKVFIALASFPEALIVMSRLREWFAGAAH